MVAILPCFMVITPVIYILGISLEPAEAMNNVIRIAVAYIHVYFRLLDYMVNKFEHESHGCTELSYGR